MRIDSPLSPKGADPGTDAAELQKRQKLHKSAGEFEAMLLTSLWKDELNSDEEDGNEMLGGMKGPLQDLAFQAIAVKAVDSHGFGIARMIERSLEPKLGSGHSLSGPERELPAANLGVMHANELPPRQAHGLAGGSGGSGRAAPVAKH